MNVGFKIALGTIILVVLLLAMNYVAGASPYSVNNNNSSSSLTFVAITQEVPFSKSSLEEIKENVSKQPHIPEKRSIPFFKGPPSKELYELGTISPEIKTQSAVPYPSTQSSLTPTLISNFIGLPDDGYHIPPDTQGAVGQSHLVETLNDLWGVFNKSTGALNISMSLQDFWSPLGTGLGQPDYFPFDPKIIYDQYSGRFIMVTMGGNSNSPPSYLMIAVSATSDPTGSWYEWSILTNNSGYWADYPGLGVDANTVYVTANIANNYNYVNSKVWVIPKAQLLNGLNPITWWEGNLASDWGFVYQPTQVFGSSSAEYFINEGWRITTPYLRRFFNISTITFQSGTPIWNGMGYIEVTPYPLHSATDPNLPQAPQLGSPYQIMTDDNRLLNAIFRNGYIWTTHTVTNDADNKTEVAWYQINPANASPSIPGTPTQQGRINDSNRWYYFPSIAVNSNGDVGIGSSGSSTSEYAGTYYTARLSSDPAGTMQSVAVLKAGLGPYYKDFGSGKNRWGDYSATVVDPSDNATFWTLQEYASTPISGTSYWGTWWGKFALNPVTPQKLTVLAKGGDNALWYRQFDGTSWSGWQSLGGSITNLDATSSGGNVYAFVRGGDGGLWDRNWSGTSWNSWQSLGGSITDLDSISPNNVYALVRGGDGGLWYRNWSGTSWSSWQTLGGSIVNITSAASGANNLDVFVRGGDGGLWYRNWDGTSWNSWQSLGGSITDLDATSSGSNIYAFVRGADGGLWYRNWDGTSWNSWQSLGGSITDLDATSSGSNIYAFVRGADGGLWYRNWNGTSWNSWQSLGGSITRLDVVSYGSNVYAFVRGGDGGLWYRNWNGTSWSGWQSLGGSIIDLDATS